MSFISSKGNLIIYAILFTSLISLLFYNYSLRNENKELLKENSILVSNQFQLKNSIELQNKKIKDLSSNNRNLNEVYNNIDLKYKNLEKNLNVNSINEIKNLNLDENLKNELKDLRINKMKIEGALNEFFKN